MLCVCYLDETFYKNFHSIVNVKVNNLFLQLQNSVTMTILITLKVVSIAYLPVCFVRLKESALETKKNVFYFASKALFVLEIIKF